MRATLAFNGLSEFMKTKFFSDDFTRSRSFKPLSANPIKWSDTLKQLVGKLPANYLSVFDHFVRLSLKGLICRKTVYLVLG